MPQINTRALCCALLISQICSLIKKHQLFITTRKMASAHNKNSLKFCSAHQPEMCSTLDELILAIYQREVPIHSICLVLDSLQQASLPLDKVRLSIMRGLEQTCQTHRTEISSFEQQLIKNKKTTLRMKKSSQKSNLKGISNINVRQELALKIYQKYLSLAMAHKKINLMWSILKGGIAGAALPFQETGELDQGKLNHLGLMLLISRTRLLERESFGRVMQQLCGQLPNMQKQPFQELLNVFYWKEETSQPDQASKKQQNSGYSLHKIETHFQTLKDIVTSKLSITDETKVQLMKSQLRKLQQGLEKWSLKGHIDSNQFEEKIQTMLIGSLQKVRQTDKIDNKETEDQSRPSIQTKQSQKKRKKKKKNKNKRKNKKQTQTVKNKQQDNQQNKYTLTEQVQKQFLEDNAAPDEINYNEDKQEDNNTNRQQLPNHNETIEMLKRLVIKQQHRSKCAAAQETVAWWQTRARK